VHKRVTGSNCPGGIHQFIAQVTNTQSFDAVTFLPTGWTGLEPLTTGAQNNRNLSNNNAHSGAGMAGLTATLLLRVRRKLLLPL